MAIGFNYQVRAVTDGRTVQNATNSETTSPQKNPPRMGRYPPTPVPKISAASKLLLGLYVYTWRHLVNMNILSSYHT